MNIFTALSQGRARISERNLTSMLGYLLNPTATHGMGDLFLREFLLLIRSKLGALSQDRFTDVLNAVGFDTQIAFEPTRPQNLSVSGTKSRAADIEVQLWELPEGDSSDVDEAELHRLGIEIKI